MGKDVDPTLVTKLWVALRPYFGRQYLVAAQAGMSSGRLTHFATGTSIPSLEQLEAIAEVIGCTAEDIEGWVEYDPEMSSR